MASFNDDCLTTCSYSNMNCHMQNSGDTVNKTTWGGEDNAFFTNFYRLGRRGETKLPKRYTDESLWHIRHKQFMNWQKSKDGISKGL